MLEMRWDFLKEDLEGMWIKVLEAYYHLKRGLRFRHEPARGTHQREVVDSENVVSGTTHATEDVVSVATYAPAGVLGLSGIEGLEATSEPVIEEMQPIIQTSIIEQLRSVTETLATMQQNQSLLMETVLALQKKKHPPPPPPQTETEGTHPSGSQTETRDNQIGEGAQNLQSKETPPPPHPETSSQKTPSIGVDLNAYVRRFRELSVDVQEPISEDRLAKICVDGMQPAFKPHLVTHHFPDFSALYEAARNLNETVESPLPPHRYQYSPHGRHSGSRQTAYAALGPPPSRSRGYPAKRPKYNEPPPSPVTAAKAQAFVDAWIQDGKDGPPSYQRLLGPPNFV
ncbi:hypothetical protein RHMOL_Rhmol10G0001700 [Rhododendron molle]|uniref:Uncharacterized protein n=1 Tax=Rhododendron molle TaxID=49168 RepID=A0ACC0LYJ2_RHOML|nr:hypothetical protein RHMOL_Rhmol10G0001700 [Rhododendron molle]